jgi:hypothetical protein
MASEEQTLSHGRRVFLPISGGFLTVLHYSVVQGVRRWMGSHSLRQTEKSARSKSLRRVKSEESLPSPIVDKFSTEATAVALLNPMVSEEEELEYQGYIDQCQELLDAPATLGERKDLEVYALSVQTGKGYLDSMDMDSEYWMPGEPPKDLVSYVERLPRYVNEGKEMFPVTFNYERWLSSAAM